MKWSCLKGLGKITQIFGKISDLLTDIRTRKFKYMKRNV